MFIPTILTGSDGVTTSAAYMVCSCSGCDTVAPPCVASRWWLWWILDDCSAKTLWTLVKTSSNVKTSVYGVWGPGAVGLSSSYQQYVILAANKNNQCVKEYLLDWIKCKASVQDSAVKAYNTALGVSWTNVRSVTNLLNALTTLAKLVGQSIFNAAANLLRARSFQVQVVMAATWC